MKFVVHMKTPDAVECAINQALESEVNRRHCKQLEPMSDDEHYDLVEDLREVCNEWFKYGECATIEIDTKEGTATVSKLLKI